MYNKAYVREALKTGLLRHETPATFHQYVPQMYNKAYVREALKTGLLPRETPATFHQHALQTCTPKHLSLSCSLSLSLESYPAGVSTAAFATGLLCAGALLPGLSPLGYRFALTTSISSANTVFSAFLSTSVTSEHALKQPLVVFVRPRLATSERPHVES